MNEPSSVDEVIECVLDHERLLPCGGRTKPGLAAADCPLLSTVRLSGMIEYEPSEFTFTARAGTSLAVVINALSANRQYLPFDPPFADRGATLGGTVAAALSGPGRLRFGGVRDFLIGVELVTGDARRVRGGGKVVKNAAGFDLPRLMAGSLGRLGVITEVSFKVFPRPPARRTAMIQCGSVDEAMDRIAALAGSPLELDALDWLPANNQIVFRVAGAAAFVESDPWTGFPGLGTGVQALDNGTAERFWADYGGFGWMEEGSSLVKVPVSPARIPDLETGLRDLGLLRCYSVAGNVAYLGSTDRAGLDRVLRERGLSGLALLGHGKGDPWLGARRTSRIAFAVKRALDPNGRFPPLVGEDEARD